VEQKGDLPVYEVTSEGRKGRSRTLHRNLLLPCAFLHSDSPEPAIQRTQERRRRLVPANQQNKLQVHPSKSKLMFIGSSYNLNNKNTEQPVVVNNTPVSRTDTHMCLGVQIDEKHSWDSHIDMI